MSSFNDNHEEQDHSSERWLVSYADFMTLMFAFFAVLYATSEQNSEKAKDFQDQIKHYLIKAGAFGETGQKINPGEKGDTPIAPPVQVFKRPDIESSQEFENILATVEEKIPADQRKKFLVDMTADELGIRLSLSGPNVYSAQSDKFSPEALKFLNTLGPILAGSKRRILIEGFVGKGQKGGFPTAWDFASARAINFLRFLEARHGVDAARLSAMSNGDSQSAGVKSEYNDRLEVVLVHEDLDL
jgi:chemotaxis protein MotB